MSSPAPRKTDTPAGPSTMTEQQTQELLNKLQELEKVNRDLKLSMEELLQVLMHLSAAISLKFESNNLLDLIADLLDGIFSYKGLTILLGDQDSGYVPVISRRMTEIDHKKVQTIIEDDVITWAWSKRRSLVLPDLEDETAASSFIIAPLIVQDSMLGCILIFVDRMADEFSASDLELLTILSSQSATAIQNSTLYNQMEESNRNLAKLKNYLNDVIDHMKNGLMVLDTREQITTFNNLASHYLGKTEAEVMSRGFRQVFDQSIVATVEKFIDRQKGGFPLGTEEIQLDRGDETPLPLRLSATCLRDEQGSETGLILMLQDMSETREIQRLRDLDKLKNELVANVSHELRTPLTSIKAYGETLLDMADDPDPDTSREFLKIICDESERLTNLISNLLDLSRMESGDFRLRPKTFDLIHLLRKSATLLHELAHQKSVSIQTSFSSEQITMHSDEGKLEQVVINLLSNAVKYNRQGGQVDLKVTTDDHQVHISVHDTGLGIPADAIDHVFEKFYRVDTSLTYEVSGTGLGLAIVKHIVDHLGGRISVRSQEGEWTEFSVTLPLRISEGSAA